MTFFQAGSIYLFLFFFFPVDLVMGVVDLQIGHGSKIDWLELNETGHKLLYRDKSATLTLLDARTGHKEILLNGCSFVQVSFQSLVKI